MTKWLNWQQNTETEPKKGGMEAQDLNGEFVFLLLLFVCLVTKWLNWQPNIETVPKKGGMEAQDLNGEFVCLFDFLFLDFSLIGNQIVF